MSPAPPDERVEVDLGAADADITDPDAYTSGVPYATFERLRTTDPEGVERVLAERVVLSVGPASIPGAASIP